MADSQEQENGQGGRIASDPRLLAALAAGLAAAVLSLWAFRGLPGGAFALWLVTLPLFMAGIGFGGFAVLAATGLASLLLVVFGNWAGLGLFLALFGVPAALLVLAADRGLRLAFVLLGLIPAAGVLLAAFLLGDAPGGLEGAMREAAETGLQRMGLPANDGLVEELVRVKAAAIGFWVALALLVNAAAASALLVRTGVIPAAPAWREARLPNWYPALPALAGGFWLAAPEGGDAVSLSLLLVLLVPVFLHGLAALHRASAALKGRTFLLGGGYAALIILSVPVALGVAGYGFYDILIGTRARRVAPPPKLNGAAMIEVILMQRVEKLGQMGELVKVRPGYARNFLLPQGKAIRANKDNLARFERERAQLEAQNLKRRGEAERVAERVHGLTVVIIRSAGESGGLYGSVSGRDIADACKGSGLTLERNQILLEQPIKQLGLTPVRVALHPEVVIEVGVNVARSIEESEKQARGEDLRAADQAEEESLEAELAAELAELGAAADRD